MNCHRVAVFLLVVRISEIAGGSIRKQSEIGNATHKIRNDATPRSHSQESAKVDYLLNFIVHNHKRITKIERLYVIKPATLSSCVEECMNNQYCTSFVYNPDRSRCFISKRNVTKEHLTPDRAFSYYEKQIPKLQKECGTRKFVDDFSGNIDGHARIAGGQVAMPGVYPWHARLYRNFKHRCGASIISEFFVVTASHCVVGYTSPGVYSVRVGDFNSRIKEDEEKDFEVARVIMHPEYGIGPRHNNDIALIQIKPKKSGTGIDFGDYVRPICLPPPGTYYDPGTPCFITGWGNTGNAQFLSYTGRKMQVAMVPLRSQFECSAKYNSGRITEGMVCAGYLKGRIDSCSGDSGGSLACKLDNDRFALFGVTSWGEGCTKPNKPGVYAKVAHYTEWIYRHLNESTQIPQHS